LVAANSLGGREGSHPHGSAIGSGIPRGHGHDCLALREERLEIAIPTGLHGFEPHGGACLTHIDLRSGYPGESNHVVLTKSRISAAGGEIVGARFSYRYVIGYSRDPDCGTR